MQTNNPWSNRIKNANKYYEEWENRFRCKTLEDYYEGFQWSLVNGQRIPENLGIRRPYTVNLVYTTIRRKIANITYSYPEFLIDPQPGNMDWNQDFAVRSAMIKQAALNTVISNPKLEFVEDIRLAAIDSFFRFAVLEIGYAEDYRNPNKPKMEMASHENPDVSESRDKVVSDEPPASNQLLYTKWISAKRFRVSMADDIKLRNCEWCGYYGFMPKEVLLNTKEFSVPAELKNTYFSADLVDAQDYAAGLYDKDTLLDLAKRGDLVKYWRIWDNVSGKERLILDSGGHEVFEKPFERIPLATHRSDLSLGGWYPIPPVWQWLSPQNEINESREQMRKYRRRSTRKFEVTKGDHDIDELEKLKSDEDGSIIVTKRKDGMPSIRPITNPDLNAAILDGLTVAKDDFDTIAAIPVATGRASDRQTATATKKLAQDQAIVESLEQIDFSRFVSAAGREILLQMSENMDEGMWIKLTADPGSNIFTEIQANQDVYHWLRTQDLADGYDFSVRVNVKDSTPAQMALEEEKYVKFLALMNTYPQIAMSAALVRETAYRVGYKNEAVIRVFQEMALIKLMDTANRAEVSVLELGLNGGAPSNGTNANNQSKAISSQNSPNSVDEINAQLNNQVQ